MRATYLISALLLSIAGLVASMGEGMGNLITGFGFAALALVLLGCYFTALKRRS